MIFFSNEVIEESTKIKDDVKFDIIRHDENFSYIVSTPIFENFEKFIELSQSYPVFPPNGYETYNFLLKQYFSLQHTKTIRDLIETQLNLYFDNEKYYFEMDHNFANIYHNLSNFKCPLRSCFPHTDEQTNTRIAVNFWISTNKNDATSIWKVKDSCFYSNESADYLNEVKNQYAKENKLSEECTDFFDLTDYMDIKKVIDIPAHPNTVTIYFSDIWHIPKVDRSGDNLRWSYVFFYDMFEKTSLTS